MHEAARDTGGLRNVLDRDLLVPALGEQRVGGVEDLVAMLVRAQAMVFRRVVQTATVRKFGGPSITS